MDSSNDFNFAGFGCNGHTFVVRYDPDSVEQVYLARYNLGRMILMSSIRCEIPSDLISDVKYMIEKVVQ